MKQAHIALAGVAVLALLSQTDAGQNAMESINALLPGAFQRSVTSGRGSQYYAEIEAIAARHGLPVNLLSRVAYQESRFNPAARNASSGALGMFQIVPKWHPTAEPLDWRKAADYAARYLVQLKRQLGTWERALAGYNWGPANVQKYGLVSDRVPTETRNYYTQILADVQGA